MAKILTKSRKNFLSEREGQIQFFADLRIDADVELTHNTDGVYKGTLFEFKLTISDINKVLFQSIKYPMNIVNNKRTYHFMGDIDEKNMKELSIWT